MLSVTMLSFVLKVVCLLRPRPNGVGRGRCRKLDRFLLGISNCSESTERYLGLPVCFFGRSAILGAGYVLL